MATLNRLSDEVGLLSHPELAPGDSRTYVDGNLALMSRANDKKATGECVQRSKLPCEAHLLAQRCMASFNFNFKRFQKTMTRVEPRWSATIDADPKRQCGRCVQVLACHAFTKSPKQRIDDFRSNVAEIRKTA